MTTTAHTVGRTIRERHIVHESGDFWVADQGWAYTVFRNVGCWAVSDASYCRNDDGLSLAIARTNYRARPRAAISKATSTPLVEE